MANVGNGLATYILTGNGYAAPPTWQPSPSTSITFTGDIGTPFATNSVTIRSNNSANDCGGSVLFDASTPNISLKVSDASLNTYIGQLCGSANPSLAGGNNSAFGLSAMNSVNGAQLNCAYGLSSLFSIGNGSANSAYGSRSLVALNGGGFNSSFGNLSGSNYTGGESSNIVIMNTGTTSENNTIRIGTQGTGNGQQNRCFVAGITGVSVSNLNLVTIDTTSGQLGSQASTSIFPQYTADTGTPFTIQNVTIYANNTANDCGSSVLFNASTPNVKLQLTDTGGNTIIGKTCGNLTLNGVSNTIMGSGNSGIALTSGSYNCFSGYQAGLAVTSGQGNVCIGATSGTHLTTSNYNTFVGYLSGNNFSTGTQNSIFGSQTSFSSVTGSYNLILGYNSGSSLNSAESSNILLENSGVSTDSHTIRIGTQGAGNGQQNLCFVAGIVGVTTSNSQYVTINSATGQLGVSSLSGTWVDQTTTPVTMTTNTGYTSDDGATLLVFTLPTTSAIGDWIEINGKGSGLWTIHQAAGQQIQISPNATTLGVGGSLSSINQYDCVRLRCIVANLTWVVVSQQSTGLTVV